MKTTENSNNDRVSFNIIESLGVLSTSTNGWTKEVNVVSWNDRPAKLDIRDWDPDHNKMSRGIGLNATEVAGLYELLQNTEISSLGI
ncbi:YdbC family protein [Fastidiosipila sanguinis]|uniref:Transcriptional coactivator p15 (PC4) C-terminal domain-containing protein n=1 Tax=Fastidiosipila sanguinis TaxID=236753 RepID=A0A2S0KNM7_9FIRM|nr:PC4/YdbC family ssDNA-binding protein [Fastidiosipila sanguinis]AVM42623.1 hypothetical protein C5Q98_05085 [Fastidiosipila sanguinis]